MLYPEPGCCAKIKRFFKRVEKYVVLHPDLHSYIKQEKRGNTAYIQAVLRNLQREAMQRYMRERQSDPDTYDRPKEDELHNPPN